MTNPLHQPHLGTFSIVALDPILGELGLAVASRAFDAGYYVTFLKTAVGSVATQALSNPHLGTEILEALEQGHTPTEALEAAITRDESASRRQVGVVDFQGRTAAYTGSANGEWAGHLTAENVSVQGNLLAGPGVVQAMLETYQHSDGPLAERLMLALEAGEAAGGDKRGKQSAAGWSICVSPTTPTHSLNCAACTHSGSTMLCCPPTLDWRMSNRIWLPRGTHTCNAS